MNNKFVGLYTIVRRQVRRTFRIWIQTILPAAITSILYFIIFGHVIGSRVGSMQGYNYIQFIAPGLIMMQIITSSYNASVSALYGDRFKNCIDEILVSPMPSSFILLGYIVGGVFRGSLVGLLVSCIALFFTHIHVYSFSIILLSALLTAAIFSTAGVINAVFAKSFDDISIIPTFVLTPLTYLGGVFYSVLLLPPFWQKLSLVNPILYMVDGFRYGFLHLADSHIFIAFSVMFVLLIGLYMLALHLFKNSPAFRQ